MAYKFKIKKPKRSWMKLSHEFKFDTGFGTLVPIVCEDILPHDTIKLSTEMFTRFTALIAPAFQRCDARIEYFFVPNRILWSDWEKFISNDQSDPSMVKPYFDLDNQDVSDKFKENSLADYLGFPVAFNSTPGSGTTILYPKNSIGNDKIDALPFRAYYKIWYDYYRDENVGADPTPVENGGALTFAGEGHILDLLSRAYPRDYFTSALPYAQQGANPVRLPLNYPGGKTSMNASKSSGNLEVGSSTVRIDGSVANLSLNQPQNIVQGPTIEEMRRSSAVQRWLEKNIRFGNRYVEQVASHFGIHPGDYRLDRPEYLGGGRVNVRISEVLQTSESGTTPLGDDGGHAIATGAASIRRSYTAQEHGWLIGLLSFVPKASYGQGWPRKFNRWQPTDFAFPEFDNLGEQPLNVQEIWAYGDDGDDVFGYKPRYDEYKHSYDRYAGQFRSTLSFWHLGRIFGSVPTLSPAFQYVNYYPGADVQTDPDRLTRMFAVDDQRNINVDLYNHIYIKRPLSKGDVSFIK